MSTPVADDEETAGLAGERTDLAWNRTALSLGVAVAAILRLVLGDLEDLGADVWVFLLITGGSLAWALSMFHARSIAATTMTGRRIDDASRLAALSYGTTLFALGSIVLAVVSG